MQDHQSLTTTGFPEFKVQFPEHEQLKCPRCDSSNTKFCYYNNYNLSQPRHFCKNCRRYWTKGGTLRNIPVGGGCRKNSKRPPAIVVNTSSIPPKQQQQQPQEHVVQNLSASAVPSPGLDSWYTQNPNLKAESGQILGPGSDSGGVGDSFTSLLGLSSEGQFGNFLDGFSHNGEKSSDGSSQNTGLDVVQGSGSSSNGLQIESEANYWASINPPGYQLQ